MTEPDPYAVLGVGRGASEAQIAKAFRRLAFRWHPDRNMNQPELSHRQFLLVHRAYETLSDPARRGEWDRTHPAPGAARAAPSAPRTASPPPPRPRPRPAPGSARPRGSERSRARSAVSGVAWLVLGLVLSTFGSVVLILFGPFVGGETIASLRRRLPAAGQFVAAMTRMLIFGGLGLLALQYAVGPIVPVRVVVILLLIGAALLLVERIVLASLWALGGGTRPRDRV